MNRDLAKEIIYLLRDYRDDLRAQAEDQADSNLAATLERQAQRVDAALRRMGSLG
jgi:hypothetical protein